MISAADIALYRGKRSLENERYFGHEFSGVVADPGDGANGIKKGMRVASFPGPADTAGIAATGFPIIAGA
ncbi:MAG: alcohol dehydrogenase catalytic domain-containing protein [Enterocloster clostridioformis]